MTESIGGAELVLRAAHTGMFGKNVPGTLTLEAGRLRFETRDGVAFDVPAAELEKPSFSFGDSVFKVMAAGKKYRFYFGDSVRPEDDDLADGVKSYMESKRAGQALKAALGMG